MNRLRVRTTVFGGAALGLIAGAALFGAVSSSATSPAPAKPALVSGNTAALPAAGCAGGQKLEHGVCIVHVEKVVVVPAPAFLQAQAQAPAAGSSQDSSSAGDHATEPSDDAIETSDDAAEAAHDAAEAAHDAAEAAHEAAEHAAELTTESGS